MSDIKPTWEREGIQLYLGDCLEVLPTLGKVDAVVTDPPYGMNATTAVMKTGKSSRWALPSSEAGWEEDGLSWDDSAPELEKFLKISKHQIIWGGQFFSLPNNRCWLVWNKVIRNFSSSVCELAWTNLDSPVDAFDYSHGQLASEGKVHPTQKPLPLMVWCVAKLPEDAETILDPFMGSGTTGVACVKLGRKFIGIEKEERYFDICVKRIERALSEERSSLFPVAKETQKEMFDETP